MIVSLIYEATFQKQNTKRLILEGTIKVCTFQKKEK